MRDMIGRHRRELLVVLAIAGASFVLRAWGAGFGLPLTYHPDEHQYVETALEVLGGEINPGRFNNPSLFKYALALVDSLWFVVGRSVGRYESLEGFLTLAREDPTSAHLLARIVTAMTGALTVAATYWLGRAAYDRRVAAVAAVLLAGTYLHARQSHFAVSDVPATLLTTLALVVSVRILAGGSLRHYVLAGAAIGAASATKYSSLASALPLVLAHALAGDARRSEMLRRSVDRRLVVAAIVAVGVFVLAVPFSVLDRAAFVADVSQLYERGRSGFKGLQLSDQSGWFFYLETLRWGMGTPYLIAALVSVGAALMRHRRVDIVLVSLPVLLYVYLGRQLLMFERFILPALPVFAVLTAELAWRLAKRAGWPERRRAAVVGVFVAGILVSPVANTIRFDWLLTQDDTRDVARAWIESNVPSGARVVAHSNGPQLAGGDRPAQGALRTFDVTYVGTTSLGEEPVQALWDDGYEYVVVSSFSYDRRLLDPDEDARRRAFYDELDERSELLRTFRPDSGDRPIPFAFAQVYGPATHLWALERPGPTIKVYRLVRGE